MHGKSMKLTEELRSLLFSRGADLVGIGDMSGVKGCSFRTGISVAVALPADVVRDLQKAPTREYYDLYYSLNDRLDLIVTAGEDFLKSIARFFVGVWHAEGEDRGCEELL